MIGMYLHNYPIRKKEVYIPDGTSFFVTMWILDI